MRGFTLIEISISVAIFAILAALISLNAVKPIIDTELSAAVAQIKNTFFEARVKSMTGFAESGSTAAKFGVFFDSTSFTLFQAPYSAGAGTNFVSTLSSGYTFSSVTFPSSQIIFTKLIGEVESFSSGQNTLIIQNTQTGLSKTMTIYKSGVIEVQ
ncbi:MAG: type II secretion system protein [Parcubacteria group bacterium]|nr:type II secretion system protein [Parcubacteria group bacterium]